MEKHLAEGMPETLLDVNQMEQVFVNLLINGVEAIQDEQGTIKVSSAADPKTERLRIEVEDTGMGISNKNMERIFEPFFSTQPKGTGLGLSVNYGIVQKHGGNIQVFSQPGQGTRFTVEIPLFEGNLDREGILS